MGRIGAKLSNQRLLSSHIWEDEFFTGLCIFDRLLWIGLISACADDQGRIIDNPSLIKSKIFPVDDISIEDINNGINRFVEAGKITRYIVDNKKAIQIINWWKHQCPRWANKSLISPPPGWWDRERYHGRGNEIFPKNWEFMGGYDHNLIKKEVKVKDEVEVKEEYSILNSGLNSTLNSNNDTTSISQTGSSLISKVFTAITGMATIPGSELPKVLPAMEALSYKYPNEGDFINYLKPFYSWWKNQIAKDGRHYSKINCAWIYDLAVTGEIPEIAREPQREPTLSEKGWTPP
jgi:hypothetical protein